MGLNWVEDLVSHLYQLRGFLVIQNEDLPMPNQAHSDIDIIAIKDGEVHHVECQTWWGPRKDDAKDLKRLEDRFENAPGHIFHKYDFLKSFVVKRVFVTSGKPKQSSGKGPWDRLTQFCDAKAITLVEINTVISQLIIALQSAYPTSHKVGKEEGIARFLLHLIHNGFVSAANANVLHETPNNEIGYGGIRRVESQGGNSERRDGQERVWSGPGLHCEGDSGRQT